LRDTFFVIMAVYCIVNIWILLKFIRQGKRMQAQSTAVSFGLFWLVFLSDLIFHLNLPALDFILLMAALILHSFFGVYLDLFHRSKTFDRLVHGFGAFSYAILVYDILSNFIQYGGSVLFRSLYAMLLGISIGAVYEIYEFAADAKRTDKMQHGLRDTDFDLIFDVAGALGAAVFIYFRT